MKIGSVRVSAVGFFFLLECSSNVVNAQNAQGPADTLRDRCVRWLKVIQPDQNSLSAANFCRGLQTGNAGGHYSVTRNSAACVTPAPLRCSFDGLVMPADTLAVEVRTSSRDGWEFPAAASLPQRLDLRADLRPRQRI